MIEKIESSACGLLFHENKILLVSNDNTYRYQPWGRQDPGESLIDGLVREIMEETGVETEIGNLVCIQELIDHDFGKHKVMHFFLAFPKNAIDEATFSSHNDEVWAVKHRKFRSKEEIISQQENFAPKNFFSFLLEHRDDVSTHQGNYLGHEPYTIK